MNSPSNLEVLVSLQDLARQDTGIDPVELARRDRDIGLATAKSATSPLQKLRHWVLEREAAGTPAAGHQLGHLLNLLVAVTAITGLASGWGLARAVLSYTGEQPVNVIHALVLLVGIQVLMLVVWLILMCPLPGMARIRNAASGIQPGRILMPPCRWLFRVLTGNEPDTAAWSAIEPRIARWKMAEIAQVFTVAFNVGALGTLFYLISVSDLAFGWNTTLNIANDRFFALVNALATPWATWVPHAVPSLELVDISRYYRLDQALAGGDTSQRELAYQLGQWWPFLAMTIAVYGLLPRLVLLVVCAMQSRRVTRDALTRAPAAMAIIDRMERPFVDTRPGPADADLKDGPSSGSLPVWQSAGIAPATLVEWSGARSGDAGEPGRQFSFGPSYTAGGINTLSDDRTTLSRLLANAPDTVVVAVRAWESPTLDFVDFCAALRRESASGTALVVLLTPATGLPLTAEQIDGWSSLLATLGDPALYLAANQ